jgi:hypothetical protein
MAPPVYQLQIYAGDTQKWRFVIWEDTYRTKPADLSGAKARASIKAGSLTIPLSCEIEPPNIVNMTLDHDGPLPANGLWDLRVERLNGEVKTLLRGPVTVMASVTEMDDA